MRIQVVGVQEDRIEQRTSKSSNMLPSAAQDFGMVSFMWTFHTSWAQCRVEKSHESKTQVSRVHRWCQCVCIFTSLKALSWAASALIYYFLLATYASRMFLDSYRHLLHTFCMFLVVIGTCKFAWLSLPLL